MDIKQQQRQDKEKKGFTLISIDESFFFYDSLARRVVWINEDKRPVIRITGSHQLSSIFGTLSMEGKQVFRQYDVFNGDTFLDYVK